MGISKTVKTLLGRDNGMLVDFVICGTQKGGTSALESYLKEHPAICMANRKEVHFFDNEIFFTEGKPDYSAYHSCFSPEPHHQRMGEATPVYMYWRDAPRRMWEYNPNMKLIAVLRNPIERAYSHWNMERSRNFETLPFLEAIKQERQRCREALPFQHAVYSYVDRGFYLSQLRRLWQYFTKDNVLVLKNEKLRAQPNEVVKTVCGFIGVEAHEAVNQRDVHSLPYSSELCGEEKEFLRHIYEFDIRGLERELDWDCSNWLEK